MNGVEFSGITKGFEDTPVLDGVSFAIAEGEFVTLLGPSGCGKSTLLRILAGLEPPDRGSVAISGKRVDGVRPKARDVAMVFQSYALYPHMSVANNMALPLRMRRLDSWQRLPFIGRFLPGTKAITREIDSEVKRTADALGIGHLLTRKPGQLSGGQRQRVAVGRAMVRQPAVFLMDEPLSNLDAKLRVQMRAEIKDLHRRLGVTFIYVTHDQAEAMTMSDRVAVMLEGRILQVAPPQQIYADPHNRRVAEFIGSPKINIIEGVTGEDDTIFVGSRRLPFASGQKIGTKISLGIRPEAFHPAGENEPRAFGGVINFIEHLGSDIFIHLTLPEQSEPLVARLPAGHASQFFLGQRLNLGVSPEQILLFGADGERLRPHASVTPLRSYAS